jgi:hypothetical protein
MLPHPLKICKKEIPLEGSSCVFSAPVVGLGQQEQEATAMAGLFSKLLNKGYKTLGRILLYP